MVRRAGRVMLMLIEKAKGHLSDALKYSMALPRRDSGVRQFCLTSLYFAVQTLRLAEHDDRLLDPTHKIKITRGDVFRTVRMTRVVAPSNLLVRLYFRRLAGSAWNNGDAYLNRWHLMRPYLDLLHHVLDHGSPKEDRTGTGTLSVFGHQIRFDLRAGFPLVTTKKVHLKSVDLRAAVVPPRRYERQYLNEHGVSIWDEWADETRRPWPGLRSAVALVADADGHAIDQIERLVHEIKPTRTRGGSS